MGPGRRASPGRKIAYLVDQIRRHGESSEMVAEVVALGQEHGIQTPYTSWLVDPERHGRLAFARQRHRPGAVPAPGGGVTSGGQGGLPASPPREAQRRALDDLGIAAGDEVFFASGSELDLSEALGSRDVDGAVATTLAKTNAELKQMQNRDRSRAGGKMLTERYDERWYNRIGRFLVDADVDEQTAITIVNFGSEAYFELARRRSDLRAALAASCDVVVLIGPGRAILVTDEGGIDAFSDAQLEQLGGPDG